MPPPSPQSVQADFPILQRQINGQPLAYLDNAATTQKPRVVIDAIVDYYEGHNANTHSGVHTLSEEATGLYEDARNRTARFINASPQEIVFTQGTTGSINLRSSSGMSRYMARPGPFRSVPIRARLQKREKRTQSPLSRKASARLRGGSKSRGSNL